MHFYYLWFWLPAGFEKTGRGDWRFVGAISSDGIEDVARALLFSFFVETGSFTTVSAIGPDMVRRQANLIYRGSAQPVTPGGRPSNMPYGLDWTVVP